MIKNLLVFMQSAGCSGQMFMKPKFSLHIFEIKLNIKFHENVSRGSRERERQRQRERERDGRTDMTKLIMAFRNFASLPNK